MAAWTPAHALARSRISDGAGFLYVAEVVGTDYVKIGFALNPNRRLRQLPSCHRGRAMRLLGVVRATMKQERTIHALLRAHRADWAMFFGNEFYKRADLLMALERAHQREAA